MSLLTDSEQIRLLNELDRLRTTTQTKVEAVLKKYKLDTIPAQIQAEVDALRREQARRHKIDGWKLVRNLAAKLVGDIDNLNK